LRRQNARGRAQWPVDPQIVIAWANAGPARQTFGDFWGGPVAV